MAAKEHVAYHESGTKNEADPCGSGSSLFPIKPIQKRCQESAGECTPGYAHKLGNESDIPLVLHNGDDNGNSDKYHDQNSYGEQLFLFIHIFDDMAF